MATATEGQQERVCTFLVATNEKDQWSPNEIKKCLEEGDDDAKVDAMEKAITALLNGEQLPQLFITIVRYVLPSENHMVQKLLLLYLETIEKTDSSGKLLPEMILICQNLRNNLQHPNEYIRGVTLRFLCRIKEEELLEPLVPSVTANLDHRHSYVRKNAVLALSAIYSLPKGELLVPDAPEIVERLLGSEQDLCTRRNAFHMLSVADQDKAVSYLFDNLDRIADWGDILQISVLDLIRRVCRSKPQTKGRFIKPILALLQSRSSAVVYECAVTLTSLSSAPTAIRAAGSCFAKLLVTNSDNNVKLIILDRLRELKDRHPDVVAELLMDMLRALATQNMDVRRKVLDVALPLVNAGNVSEVVNALKKEAVKTLQQASATSSATESELAAAVGEYRTLLVGAIRYCALRFPNVASSVLHLLMDFLSEPATSSAIDVAHFIREIAGSNPALHDAIIERLLEALPLLRSSRVASCCLWVISEFCTTRAEIQSALDVITDCLGPGLLATSTPTEQEEPAVEKTTAVVRPVVLADGSYATQSAMDTSMHTLSASVPDGNGHSLRGMILGGDVYVGAAMASCFVKMLLRLGTMADVSSAELNKTSAHMMMLVARVLTLTETDDDSSTHMNRCLRILGHSREQDAATTEAWLHSCRASFDRFLRASQQREAADTKHGSLARVVQPDERLEIGHLASQRATVPLGGGGDDEIAEATGMVSGAKVKATGRLSKVVQLTGFADPLYAEAYVTSHRYDFVLDVVVVNRTEETLQAVTLELATMGDLKLVERPRSYTLASGESKSIRATIKVSSTETGAIFGNLVYESAGRGESGVVVLTDIHIDIMDYIAPATCSDSAFRSMWAEFEWENKVAVSTTFTDPRGYLDHIIACTNMKLLTPEAALEGECGFLTANLYARSVFGEDALVNVSVEAPEGGGPLTGYIRIRSKTQGIALSLGDRLILKSKEAK